MLESVMEFWNNVSLASCYRFDDEKTRRPAVDPEDVKPVPITSSSAPTTSHVDRRSPSLFEQDLPDTPSTPATSVVNKQADEPPSHPHGVREIREVPSKVYERVFGRLTPVFVQPAELESLSSASKSPADNVDNKSSSSRTEESSVVVDDSEDVLAPETKNKKLSNGSKEVITVALNKQ